MGRKVWSVFQRIKNDGSVLRFRVQDCGKEYMDDVNDIYSKYFTDDESINILAGIANNDKIKTEVNELHDEMLNESGMHIVVCIEYGMNIIERVVGVSSMKLTLGTEPDKLDYKPQSKEVFKLYEILDGMAALYNVPKNYSVDKWYDGRGVVVHPDYRGYGIGSALLASRPHICREKGVPITSAWMTSIGTQKGAKKDGWETAFEIDTTEFANKFNVSPYDSIAPTFKVMVRKV